VSSLPPVTARSLLCYITLIEVLGHVVVMISVVHEDRTHLVWVAELGRALEVSELVECRLGMDVTRVLELEMFSGVGEVVLEDRCRAGRTLLLPRLAGGLRHAGALAAGGLQPRAALARKAVVDRRNRLPQRDCLSSGVAGVPVQHVGGHRGGAGRRAGEPGGAGRAGAGRGAAPPAPPPPSRPGRPGSPSASGSVHSQGRS